MTGRSASTATGRGSRAEQRAAVTGAGRGIGQQIAVELAQAGSEVAVLDVRDTAETVGLIEAAGGAATGMRVDVTRRRDVEDALRAAGGTEERLDVLVTSAAIYGESADLTALSESDVDEVFDVNLKGTMWSVGAALPMLRKRGGRVVCIGSVSGKVGGVLAGPHYAASKGGVHAFVKWAAKTEAEHGVRVNGVAPGVVDTDMIIGQGYDTSYCPLGRFADPSEIARVAAFLASPGASYLTGTIVDVNGGYSMA